MANLLANMLILMTKKNNYLPHILNITHVDLKCYSLAYLFKYNSLPQESYLVRLLGLIRPNVIKNLLEDVWRWKDIKVHTESNLSSG